MAKEALDARTAAEFAAAWLRGEAQAEAEEMKASLAAMGKKAQTLALEVPELLAFMADQALIPPDEVDKYLLELDWTANPAVTERMLRYKQDPPKTAPTPKEKKAPAPSPRDDWTTEKLPDGTWKLKSYKGKDTVVHIPEVLGKSAVSEIGERAVFGSEYAPRMTKELVAVRKAIREVFIPGSIKTIGNSAFFNCDGLSSVTIAEGVTGIGREAFCWCENLMTVTLPSSVIKIEYHAFSRCPKLTIHAPAGSYAEQYAKENNIPFVAEG